MLAVEPRARSARSARWVGVSDQTSARRYRKLGDRSPWDIGLVRGRSPAGSMAGAAETTPGGANAIATRCAAARYPWVRLYSGGTEWWLLQRAARSATRSSCADCGQPRCPGLRVRRPAGLQPGDLASVYNALTPAQLASWLAATISTAGMFACSRATNMLAELARDGGQASRHLPRRLTA